jgi:hypothetical protein
VDDDEEEDENGAGSADEKDQEELKQNDLTFKVLTKDEGLLFNIINHHLRFILSLSNRDE